MCGFTFNRQKPLLKFLRFDDKEVKNDINNDLLTIEDWIEKNK